MTSAQERLAHLHGADVYDRDGDKIGTLGQLYTDSSGQPTWASVNTGLFGVREPLVPVQDARWHGDQLQVSYDKATVKDAPNVDINAMTRSEEQLRVGPNGNGSAGRGCASTW